MFRGGDEGGRNLQHEIRRASVNPLGCDVWRGGVLREENLPCRAQGGGIEDGVGWIDALCEFRVGASQPWGIR